MKKSLIAFLIIFAFFAIATAKRANAQAVEYKDQPVVDSDLDGLTDQGEIQLYHTDPKLSDTDHDGYGDGVEVLSGSDPIDAQSFPGAAISKQDDSQQNAQESPFAWYIARAGGFVAFLLLYISIFVGLTFRVELLRKIFPPVYTFSFHCWISLQALLFALLHGAILLLDKTFNFSVADIFIPFASNFQPNLMAMGIIGFYLMLLLVATSYFKKFISQRVWRVTHFLNIILYFAVIMHAYFLGTDMNNDYVRWIFILANAFLIFVMLINIETRIFTAIKSRINKDTENITKQTNENLS